jgi:hypothetical protein
MRGRTPTNNRDARIGGKLDNKWDVINTTVGKPATAGMLGTTDMPTNEGRTATARMTETL